VAQGALEEYFSFLKIRPYKTYVLYTFVDMTKFCTTHLFPAENRGTFRLVSIGALRLQKNHRYLVEAFKLLREENIELHIFGMGPFQPALQKTIEESNVNIILKGEVQNMQDVLPQYDLFVMSSTFEGFSLAVLETMAVKVPMLLSDIVSFREQCSDTALYFDLGNPEDFAIKVKSIKKDQALQQQLSNKAYERVKQNFTLEHHMERLRKIYIDTLNDN
jgi:glycosyltransferase involved in cell wall biosynthesis